MNETQITLSDQEIKERTRSLRRSEAAELDFDCDPSELLVPRNGAQLLTMANTLSTAGVTIKDIFRESPGACVGLIMMCAPYRINPLQASWKLYQTKTDGPLVAEAQLITAMLNKAAPIAGRLKYAYEAEGVDRVCIVTAVDKESGEVLEYRSPKFSAIGPKNSPLWKTDPDQQQAYSSARAFARRHYPEVLLGVYDREEVSPAIMPPMRTVSPTQADAENPILQALPDHPEVTPSGPDIEPVDRDESVTPDIADDDKPINEASERLARVADAIERELIGVKTFEELDTIEETYAPLLAQMADEMPARAAGVAADMMERREGLSDAD